jgi:hypothetical protein
MSTERQGKKRGMVFPFLDGLKKLEEERSTLFVVGGVIIYFSKS